MATEIPDIYLRMINLLRLLSSGQEQLSYQADVPAEPLCMWFDDQYHPDDPFFRSSFTADELEALAEFHRYYDKHSRVLPEARGTIRTWFGVAGLARDYVGGEEDSR